MNDTLSFLFGISETLHYLVSGAFYVHLASSFLASESATQLGIAFLIFSLSVAWQILPQNYFWRGIFAMATISAGILLIFLLGGFTGYDFVANALHPPPRPLEMETQFQTTNATAAAEVWFVGGPEEVLRSWTNGISW